jgi:hypothetical protein
MCSGISSIPKISSGSRSRLKSKNDESWDRNQNQKKGMRREDHSRMVRFFDGKLFSSSGFFPLSAMALGVFSGGGGREGVKWWKVCASGFSTGGAILLAVEVHQEWWMAGVYWWEYQTTGVSLDVKGFFVETVFMVPEWGFSADSTPRSKSLCVFGYRKGSRMRSKQWRFVCTN